MSHSVRLFLDTIWNRSVMIRHSLHMGGREIKTPVPVSIAIPGCLSLSYPVKPEYHTEVPDRAIHFSARRGDTYQLNVPNPLFFCHLESRPKWSEKRHGSESGLVKPSRDSDGDSVSASRLHTARSVRSRSRSAVQRKIPAQRCAPQAGGIYQFVKMRERGSERERGREQTNTGKRLLLLGQYREQKAADREALSCAFSCAHTDSNMLMTCDVIFSLAKFDVAAYQSLEWRSDWENG